MLSNIWTRYAVGLCSANIWKKASNTPELIRRQNFFHTLFQLPNSVGNPTPSDIPDCEEVHRFQKLAVVTPLVSTA